MEEEKNLGALNVAVMYVGAIMGAGFASGRETWQYFGVFKNMGTVGAFLFAILFTAIGFMIRYIALRIGTNDMGKIIVPGSNAKIENMVGYFMALILAAVMVIMTAAGGAILNQHFGVHRAVGGAIITLLTVLTVLGDFERISKVFKYIMPALCLAMITVCIAVIIIIPPSEQSEDTVLDFSPAAPNWLIASLLYTAYNVMALISISATASLRARTPSAGKRGTFLGGAFLGILAILILVTVQKDPAFSQSMEMPVLGYAAKVSPFLSAVYTIVLFAAIYSAATSNFYGFTTKLKDGKHKKAMIVAAAVLAFVLGLAGFKNIIKYLSPVMGYAGLAIIGLMFCNFILIRRKENHDG